MATGARPLTFLAVMLVVVEDEAAATLALVAAEGVDAVLLAAAVVLGALVLVCRGARREGRSVHGPRAVAPQGKWGAWPGVLPTLGEAGQGAEVKAMVGVRGTASCRAS